MKGTIFNIQKFSIHDGPGIRTTVFLKGCPLRCKWCSNPESQDFHIQLLHDQSKCSRCKTCIHLCPSKAITMKEARIFFDASSCLSCLQCVKSCPTEAISHAGEQKSVSEVVDICLQDLDFYEESGGGVTISGGEGMCQPEFVKELLIELKKHKIHTAIETTGYIKAEIFRELASMFDLLLFDVKQADAKKHLEGTSVSNERIIKNLSWAIENNLNVLPRIPVIPGFNASLEDAREISELLVKVGAKQVQLLPFHQFGERKYELLHKDYALKKEKALHPEDLTEYQKIFLSKGISCFF